MPFINRLVEGLAVKHEVYILGFNEELTHKLPNVHYVGLGSNQNKLRFISTTFKYALKSASIKKLFLTFKNLFKGKRQLLQAQNLDFVLKKISPDIIHLQWPSVIPWFEQVLLDQKIPVIISQRGFHNNVRPFIDEENFKYLQKWYPRIAGFHSVSKAIAANGDKIYSSSKKVDKVGYTGLSLQEIPFSEKYKISKPLQLLSIGRTHWIKGYDYALRTCSILKENNIPFKYTIIGGAEDEELQFLISDLGLSDFVKLKGRIPQNQVFNLMRESSLLLMPSLEEGIPNVVVEAMAIGLPVISTNCGGVPELISNGVNGWIVPTRNPEAMADTVLGFLDLSKENIEQVRIEARKKVAEQHNNTKMISGMEELYYEAIMF